MKQWDKAKLALPPGKKTSIAALCSLCQDLHTEKAVWCTVWLSKSYSNRIIYTFFLWFFFIKQLYWGYSVTNTYYFTNHWHFFIDTMQVLQKNSRYDGQFLEFLRKLNSRLQQNFSSKPQEKSSSLMSPYKHYSTDLQLTFLGTIFFSKLGLTSPKLEYSKHN